LTEARAGLAAEKSRAESLLAEWQQQASILELQEQIAAESQHLQSAAEEAESVMLKRIHALEEVRAVFFLITHLRMFVDYVIVSEGVLFSRQRFARLCVRVVQELFSVQSQYQMQEDLTQIAAASELRKLQDTAFQKSN